jgi:hypothetical protein
MARITDFNACWVGFIGTLDSGTDLRHQWRRETHPFYWGYGTAAI